MTNPFAPPASRVKDFTTSRGSPFKAVIVGLVVDFGGTTIAGVLLTIDYGIVLGSSGASADQLGTVRNAA